MKKLSYSRQDEPTDYEAEAIRFQARYGYTLPPEYLAYLQLNGTGSEPSPGHLKGECYIDDIFKFSAEDKDSNSMCSTIGKYEDLLAMDRITKNVLPIASAQGGHVIFCLVLDGPLYGYVITIDDDELILPESYTEAAIDLNSDRINGKNFSDFIDQFEPDEE
jgi:hypothetical protein